MTHQPVAEEKNRAVPGVFLPPIALIRNRRRCSRIAAMALRAAIVGALLLAVVARAGEAPCIGDCNADDAVRIDELILAVNVALGSAGLSSCPTLDIDGNLKVEINELINAVNRAQNGCNFTPAPTTPPTTALTATEPPAVTPTPTPTFGIIDLGCAAAGGCIAVVNELDRNVSFLPMDRMRAAARRGGRGVQETAPATVAVEGVPRSIAVSPDGRLAFVTTRGPDRIAMIDIASLEVVEMDGLGALPEAVAITPDAATLLVTNFQSGTVSVIGTAGMRRHLTSLAGARHRIAGAELVAQGAAMPIDVGVQPNALAIAAQRERAYVTNFGSRSVSVIDTAMPRLETTITDIDENPNAVAISPDGTLAYVSSFNKRITVIRTDTNAIVTSFRVLSTFDTRPTGVGIRPDGGALFVTNFNLSSGQLFGSVFVYPLDPATGLPNAQPRRLDFRDNAMGNALPSAIRVTEDAAVVTNFLVASDGATTLRAQAEGGTLAMIDAADPTVIESVPVGSFPVSLAEIPTPAEPAPTVMVTPVPTATPSDGELCGNFLCLGPAVCIRDLGCHRNGCPPRDKCCPPDELDCRACEGGANDGAPCDDGSACPGGSCAAPCVISHGHDPP
jgi:YVTN family beta-propeller protein